MRQCCRAPSVTRLADPADHSCRTDALRRPTQDGRDNPEGRGVIDCDDNRRTDRSPFGEPRCVVVVTLAVEQSAAVNPDQDWILPSPRVYREDIEIEAIL